MSSAVCSPILLAHVAHYRFVEFVSADAQRLVDDEAAERDYRYIGRAAAYVDDHVAYRLAYGHVGPYRGRHRLFYQVRFLRADFESRFEHGAPLNVGRPGWDAYHEAVAHKALKAFRNLFHELAEHVRHRVVRYDAVAQRAYRHDVARRLAYHDLRVLADGEYLSRRLVHRDDGGLAQDDALALYEYQDGRRPEVYAYVFIPQNSSASRFYTEVLSA